MNSPIIISLDAEWPTPSWSYEKTDIKVDENKKSLTVNYLGSRRPGVALQVIKSFSAEVKVSFPSKGTWTLIITGKAENWEGKVQVEE